MAAAAAERKGVVQQSLFEFLQDAGLHQHFASLRDVLHVYEVPQLKYVTSEDLVQVGMSKPEARRLLKTSSSFKHKKYTNRLKQLLLLPSGGQRLQSNKKDEFLLNEEQGNLEMLPPPPMPPPERHDMIISAESISIYKELGQGEFGVVQQGVLTDINHGTHQVAVKCLNKDRLMQNVNADEFMKEFHMMQAMDHPNILRLFGAVLEPSRIMLITELAPLRSLLECLKEPAMRPSLTVSCLADYAKQIASGMSYLEGKRLIHRDLAARNILVFSKDLVKVSDFGLSRALGVGKDYYQTNFSANLKLPIAWCAPESITFLKFTSSSDVWAFGVTLWEMFSYGFQPWAAHTGQQILQAIDEPNFQRLEQPLHCPTQHYDIMDNCWSHRPSDRPSFFNLLSLLDNAQPRQVRVVKGTQPQDETRGRLKLRPGQTVTILDERRGQLTWKGVLEELGKVGLFDPTFTEPISCNITSNTIKSYSLLMPSPEPPPETPKGSTDVNSELAPLISSIHLKPRKPQHEYQSISDDDAVVTTGNDEFSSPLDFGPSLTEEVFGELHQTETRDVAGTGGAVPWNLKAVVVGSLSRVRSHQKKCATVKPIKAADERTLESAIAMANALASKSMHDLDKRCCGDFDPASPVTTTTPSSPTKKFFWFPSARSSSPKGGGCGHRPFLQTDSSTSTAVENMLSTESLTAYQALIENNAVASRSSGSGNNLLPPLPPKPDDDALQDSRKRHVRKNPLVIHHPSAAITDRDAATFRLKKTPGLTVRVPHVERNERL